MESRNEFQRPWRRRGMICRWPGRGNSWNWRKFVQGFEEGDVVAFWFLCFGKGRVREKVVGWWWIRIVRDLDYWFLERKWTVWTFYDKSPKLVSQWVEKRIRFWAKDLTNGLQSWPNEFQNLTKLSWLLNSAKI